MSEVICTERDMEIEDLRRAFLDNEAAIEDLRITISNLNGQISARAGMYEENNVRIGAEQ